MTDDVQSSLLEHLVKRYTKLKRQLVRVLGNDDLAGDALHDTWLRLQHKENQELIQSPSAYLLRMAVNIAVDMQRRQARSLSVDDVDALMQLADPGPGPAQQAEGQSELEALGKIMARLPERRRQILLLVRWEGLSQKDVAERLGVSVRTVENELKRAHDYCAQMMKAKK